MKGKSVLVSIVLNALVMTVNWFHYRTYKTAVACASRIWRRDNRGNLTRMERCAYIRYDTGGHHLARASFCAADACDFHCDMRDYPTFTV